MPEKISYTFVNESVREYRQEDDISLYEDSDLLGRGLSGTILVKWTNQTYHDENLRAMFTPEWDKLSAISKANRGRHRNQYYAGLIVRASFDVDFLDDQTSYSIEHVSQPTGADSYNDGLTAYVTANTIIVRDHHDPQQQERKISHPNFARLHDVQFSQDGKRIITASSSLDMLYELDIGGEEAWSLDLWDISDTNLLGQRFRRTVPEDSDGWLINPNPVQLRDNPELLGANCVLSKPELYDGLGLPTNLIPVFINSIAYGNKDEILTTSFHKGEGWKIDRAKNQITVLAKDMRYPHGLRRDPMLGGYIVTDTGHEKTLFLSEDGEKELAVNFQKLNGHKPGQEQVKWLQYTTRLKGGTYCAILSSRQQIMLFDPITKVKREIPYSPDWGIQLVTD